MMSLSLRMYNSCTDPNALNYDVNSNFVNGSWGMIVYLL